MSHRRPQVLWDVQDQSTDNKLTPQAHPNQSPISQLNQPIKDQAGQSSFPGRMLLVPTILSTHEKSLWKSAKFIPAIPENQMPTAQSWGQATHGEGPDTSRTDIQLEV